MVLHLPNQLTIARIILSPVFYFLYMSKDPLLKQISAVVFIIAAITDWYDGWLARKYNYITQWGKFLDPLADKVLTSAGFFALASLGYLEFWMVWIIVLRDFLITGLRVYAEFKKKSFTTSRSAKWKTFAQMFFLYYLLLVTVLMTIGSIYDGNKFIFELLLNEVFVYFIMLAITLFTLVTGIWYLIKNKLLIKQLFLVEDKPDR